MGYTASYGEDKKRNKLNDDGKYSTSKSLLTQLKKYSEDDPFLSFDNEDFDTDNNLINENWEGITNKVEDDDFLERLRFEFNGKD